MTFIIVNTKFINSIPQIVTKTNMNIFNTERIAAYINNVRQIRKGSIK